MARPTYMTTDPAALRPIVEALIFASEEPLAARLLVRFLAGEREETKKGSPAAEENVEIPESAGAVEVTSQPEPAEAQGEENLPDFSDNASVDIVELAEAVERAEDRASGVLIGDGFGEPIDQRLLRRLIDELNVEYQESGRAFRIVEIAGGFQFATIREYGEYVVLLSKEKNRRRLSPAALETLSIIAYRQPVAKPELESIRGVNSDQVLLSLLEKNLIAITGRADTVGRPLLYGTTDDFLRIFGLNSLSDLPKLREIEELMEEDAYSAERVETITIAESSDVEEIEARVGAAGRGAEEEPDPFPHDETLVFDMTSGPGEEEKAVEEENEAGEVETTTEDRDESFDAGSEVEMEIADADALAHEDHSPIDSDDRDQPEHLSHNHG